MTESVQPFTPTTVPAGADCVKNGTCPSPPGFRRSYRAVFAEGLGRAVLEESKLFNNVNGDAGITPAGRLIRVVAKGIVYFIDQNSINLSNIRGAKWKPLGLLEVLRDNGSCEYCAIPDPEES
jgi:hypothetical protein